VSAAVDWSSDEASEEVVTSMLDDASAHARAKSPPVVPPAPRVDSPAPPQPPPPLSEEAEKAKRRLSLSTAVDKPQRKSREKDKSRKSGSKSKEKSSSSSKKSKHKEKKDLIVYNPKNDTHSAPKRMGRQVRTIAAVITTAPGKLSYGVGEDAVIVEQLSLTWAKARIGDRTGLIKLADVEDVAYGVVAASEPTAASSTASSRRPGLSMTSTPSPEKSRLSPVVTRARSGSTAYEQQSAVAIELYDAAKHEKAKRDYLRRRARASGVGIDDLAARGTNDASLSTPLFFEAGAKIHLLSAPDDRPFWQGELDGRIGSFHSSCVQRASDSSPPPPPPPEDGAGSQAARRLLSKTHGGVISPASSSGSGGSAVAPKSVANLRKKALRPLSQQAAPPPW
jgi:dipeptidyl aminopeptidase/acylaminoacyl peptidase